MGKDFGYKEESWLSLAWNAENSLSLPPGNDHGCLSEVEI